MLNTHINNELERIVSDVNNINLSIINELEGERAKKLSRNHGLLNKFYLASLLMC
jgi:hypothetical protein